MDSDSEQYSPTPTEIPNPGEILKSRGYLPKLYPVTNTEDNGYQRIPLVRGSRGQSHPKGFQVTMTDEYKKAMDKGNLTPQEFTRQRAANGTGPGGTKMPMYWEPSPELPSPPSLSIDREGQLEVVAVQKGEEGEDDDFLLIVKYVGGPAKVFTGDNRLTGLDVNDIASIDGQPTDAFFQNQAFAIPLTLETTKILQKNPPNIGFGRLMLTKLFGGKP